MAESLLAIVLVTASAKGGNLVFRWPPKPVAQPRLCKPKPDDKIFISQLDNPWRASLSHHPLSKVEDDEHDYSNDPEYRWQRPGSPTQGRKAQNGDPYEYMLGYSCEFLATLLCPQRTMCHQRFELVVDDLAFIGHPVSAEEGGVWKFKPEKVKPGSRGRDSAAETSTSHSVLRPSASPERKHPSQWLQRFQLALVLDRPDPSSSASGNVSKYLDTIYEQICFTFAAVLFQEQVLDNFVERECDALISLQESLMKKGEWTLAHVALSNTPADEPFELFVEQALLTSSIASAMKAVFEAIKSRAIAYVSLNAIPLELQLPPHLDDLLHPTDIQDVDTIANPEDEAMQAWGPELSFGWKLPGLAPWKSLLLLEGEGEMDDPLMSIRGGNANGEEGASAESLVRFLETASITVSLAEMGAFLDWDVETEVYPVVRWLVLHRRAKVVDTVHLGLKTIFALPSRFPAPLPQLSEDFSRQFAHPEIPPLPHILDAISSSLAKHSDNHFFASVVKKKDLVPLYHDVVVWLLKRDMLVTLHLHIRIVATRELKARVYEARERARARRRRKRGRGTGTVKLVGGIAESLRRAAVGGVGSSASRKRRLMHEFEFEAFDDVNRADADSSAWHGPRSPSGRPGSTSMSRKSSGHGRPRRFSSADSRATSISELVIREEEEGDMHTFDGDFVGEGEEDEHDDEDSDETHSSGSDEEDDFAATMINDPGRATPKQRRWLTAMSEGQDPVIARRFEE